MEHTALPWASQAVQHDEVHIVGPDGMALELATVFSVGDAALIVRAVNNHAKLLTVLEADVKWFVKQWEFYMNCGQRGAAQEVSLLLDDAREAIEEARK